MLRYIRDAEHYALLTEQLDQVKETLWIGTADLKDLYVKESGRTVPFLALLEDKIKKGVSIRLALSRLGILYRNIKNYNKALEILGQAEDMLKEQNQESFEGYTEKIRNSWEFARVYAALNNHSKAKSYYLNTLELLDAQLVFAGRTMPEDTGKLIREAELYSEKAGDSEGVEYFQNYCFGPSGQKDTEEKEEDFEGLLEAAYNGNSDMQYKLRCMYYEGEGVVQSYKKAYKWFKLAANDGNPQAQFMVGLLNYSEENYKEAAKWFRMASRQGVIIAKTYLGIAFDVKKKTIHGNVGCNLINGGF